MHGLVSAAAVEVWAGVEDVTARFGYVLCFGVANGSLATVIWIAA